MSEATARQALRKEFAQRLARHMDAKGWSQSDLARNAARHMEDGEFRRDNVSVYLKGAALPRPKQLNALSAALGISPDELMPGGRLEREILPISMRTLKDNPQRAYLHVDMEVTTRIALSVMALLQEAA